MKNSVLITDSGVNKVTGGGVVSYNLMESLISTTTLQYILSSQKFDGNKIGDIPSYSINPINYGYTEPQWKTSPFLLDYLAFHMLDNRQTDIVMTYGCPMGLAVEELKRNFGTKIICDLAPHNIDVSREEHIKYSGGYPYPHLTSDYLWGLYSRHLRFADVVVVHSKKSADYMMGKARLKEIPRVIPHGCYSPDVVPPLPDVFTGGYFGAIGIDKGTIYLVNAWLQCNYPESQMLIGGREAQGFKVDDKYMPRFKVTGYVDDLADFYKRVSIGVFPSVIEGFGIPILETLSFGRPVIVSESAGASEIVTDGKDGFVVPVRDIEAIKSKIMFFYDNPDEIKRMGAEARKTAEMYSWVSIQNQYKKIIQELL